MSTHPPAPLERYYHDLIGSLGAIVWEADAQTFQFTFVSPQAEAILGYPPPLWLTHDFWIRTLHPDDRDAAVATCAQGLREGRDTQFEYRMLAADGGVRWIHDVVRLVRDGAGVVRQLRGIMVDVTGRRAAEAHQQRLRAMVSHDLNNPLAVILLNADVLAETPGGLPPEQAELVRGILRSAELMQRLVADLSRPPAGAPPRALAPRPVPAAALVADAARLGRPLAEARGVAMVSGPAPEARVCVDPERILQVFGNLVGNAVRYTPPGGAVRVDAEEDGAGVRFSVADSGAGMPPARLAALLAPHGEGRPGLGLAIAREIVEAHGGSLSGHTRPGEGSTFWFTLPRA
jgi:PAS domain S-box-containing protein